MEKLWSKTKIGEMELPHRLAMAPMTRSRSQEDGTPGELTSLYYAQRASMGLVITEGTQPSDNGQGYLWSPGIYTDKHIEGWKKVTEADPTTFFDLGSKGYTDYPTMEELESQEGLQ
ncbi:hypothetical protein [Paenibacillus terrae]|uniref:oxidoreductase n=1 Tax=Paenibacillus terrae TaxID=159743 RepID=UPI0026D90D19